ncbi:hypothetical protein PUN28_015918 [Cardiocondyla obscurior]|uniref:Uncharacterized protein n=1 Tax=Cardiocondyla obscurior TaxID=286306 RepID=A0AAW2ETW4_9HYME
MYIHSLCLKLNFSKSSLFEITSPRIALLQIALTLAGVLEFEIPRLDLVRLRLSIRHLRRSPGGEYASKLLSTLWQTTLIYGTYKETDDEQSEKERVQGVGRHERSCRQARSECVGTRSELPSKFRGPFFFFFFSRKGRYFQHARKLTQRELLPPRQSGTIVTGVDSRVVLQERKP